MSDVNEKVTLTVTVEGAMTQFNRSDKPQFMLDSDYDMNTMFGACALMAQVAKELATANQKPEFIIERMAQVAKTLL